MDCLVNFENIEWVQIAKGLRCKTYICGNKTIRLLELSEGFKDETWCFHEHTNYIVDGEFSADFDGETATFKKGEVLYIPKGKKHKAVVGKNQRVLMLDF